MMERLRSKRSLVALGALVAFALAFIALTRDAERSTSRTPTHDHPSLFGAPPSCSRKSQPVRRATRAEQHGYLYAERYPYDPRDGIQAVLRFQEAQSCYQDSGRSQDATRVGQLASNLMVRINTDYASSRLVLETALGSENWSVALSEVRRLLGLTEHMRGHAYVEHLWSIVGRVTIRANDAL